MYTHHIHICEVSTCSRKKKKKKKQIANHSKTKCISAGVQNAPPCVSGRFVWLQWSRGKGRTSVATEVALLLNKKIPLEKC